MFLSLVMERMHSNVMTVLLSFAHRLLTRAAPVAFCEMQIAMFFILDPNATHTTERDK